MFPVELFGVIRSTDIILRLFPESYKAAAKRVGEEAILILPLLVPSSTLISAGISDLNFISHRTIRQPPLSCQSQIAMAVVEWHRGWLGSPAGWASLVLACNLPPTNTSPH